MAVYRRLKKKDYETLKKNYQKHYDSKSSGIFAKNKRQRLFSVKGDGKDRFQNEPDFWLDVRTFVKHGIVDLKLVADVANNKQQKMMFGISEEQFSIVDALHSILKIDELHVIKNTPTTYHDRIVRPTNDELAWKSYLAYSLVKMSIEFFMKNISIHIPLAKRTLDDSIDVLRNEMLRFSDKLNDEQKFLIEYNFGYVYKDYLPKPKSPKKQDKTKHKKNK